MRDRQLTYSRTSIYNIINCTYMLYTIIKFIRSRSQITLRVFRGMVFLGMVWYCIQSITFLYFVTFRDRIHHMPRESKQTEVRKSSFEDFYNNVLWNPKFSIYYSIVVDTRGLALAGEMFKRVAHTLEDFLNKFVIEFVTCIK